MGWLLLSARGGVATVNVDSLARQASNRLGHGLVVAATAVAPSISRRDEGRHRLRQFAGSHALRASIGALDQVAYSLTNFLVTVLVARHVSGSQFGAFAVLYSTTLIGIAVNRGIAAEPLVIRFSAADREAQNRAAVAGLHLSIGVGFIFGAMVAAGSAVLLPAGAGGLGWTFAAATPLLLVQDYVRYVGLALRRPNAALANDLTALVIVLGSAFLAQAVNGRGAAIFVAAWGAAELVGALIGLRMLRLPALRRSERGARADLDLGMRFGLDNFATQVAQQGAAYTVASISGLAAAAGLRAGQTALTPIAVLTQCLQTALLPELVRLRSRDSGRQVTRALLAAGVGLASVSAILVAAELFMPDRYGAALLGANWAHGRALLPILGIGTVAGALANTAVLGLRVYGDARNTLRSRSVAITLTLSLVITGTALDAARGAAIGIASATVCQVVVWWLSYRAGRRQAFKRQQVDAMEARWRALVGGVEPADLAARLQQDARAHRLP